MKPNLFRLSLVLTLSLAACGDDDDDDGTPDASDVDATVNPDAPTGACAEFAAPAGTIDSVPGSYDGDLAGTGADLEVAQGVCSDERAFFAQAGEDQVVAVTGLTAGTDYGVRVVSAADTSLYVATGCTGAAGPGAGECLLFVDSTLTGEFGPFTAPSDGNVFVVVDQFGVETPADATYTLEVYELECTDATDCTEAGDNACVEGTCVECATSFDCEDSANPACGVDHTCGAGFDMCTGDDAAENGDDGPSGATPIGTPSPGTPAVEGGSICSLPSGEVDFYSVTVAEGDDRVFVLDWTGAEDLDLVLWDSEGTAVASSFFDQPEVIRADAMPAGTYYLRVSQFTPMATAAAVPYTVSVSIPECATSFDCTDPGTPVCDATAVCAAGPDDCVGDDAAENGDDGPAGATDVTPAIGAMTTTNGKICNTPSTEADFFAVTVNATDDLDVQLSWTDVDADLDITTLDETGVATGLTYWQSPETVSLTHLPAGTQYIKITYFGPATTAAVDYTLTVSRTAGAGCTTTADCAAVYETQFYRGVCNGSGACEYIDGGGAVANGGACDSPDDCSSGMCSYLVFESDADLSVCTVACSTTAECDSALGSGYACTTPFVTNICHPICDADTECGANTGSETLDSGLPWDYLTCNSGVCDL